jgi:hypothetical protein
MGMSGVAIDWSSSAVHDGRLEVELSGELPRGWKRSFERTVAMLQRGDWGTVKLRKGQVRVDDVPEGGEAKLHHFLESVVAEANAAHGVENEDDSDDRDDDDDGPVGVDEEMTERFRSFAQDADG